MSNQQQAQHIWVRCFEESTNSIRAGTTSANPPADTALTWQEVLNRAFDPATNTLRLT